MPIERILIANRGEIAVRVIRTCQNLGISTVAVHSDADAGALHVDMADDAVRIGAAPAAESYLNGEAIIEAALSTGAEAIHPGYGFLSESPDFVEAVRMAGLVFIGPSAKAIRAMGLKDQAKALMEEAGVPVVPGYHGPRQDTAFLAERAEEIGFPVLIKARAGGGGKGIRRVERFEGFQEALASAGREAEASFGDPACIIERSIQSPRHVEMQILGDGHGNVVHLFERDCSLQRRHQKVIEEAPAPGMTDELRTAMGDAAVAAARAVDYVGAGTVEFIVDGAEFPSTESFWFMEMNTRLQVEHPVTELVTGLDLVALQIAVAEGAVLPFSQNDLSIAGHAIEARLYAEDPANGFLPAVGRLDCLHFGDGVRVDTGVREGDEISSHYDPMIAKLIALGQDRAEAFRRLGRSLECTRISGIETNRDFLVRLASDEDIVSGAVDTGLIGRKSASLVRPPGAEALDHAFAALAVLRRECSASRDPYLMLGDFRLYGQARQTVRFGEDEVVTVETTGTHRHARTPRGEVAISEVSWQGDELTCVVDGCRVQAHVYRDGRVVTVDRRGGMRRFALAAPNGIGDSGSPDAVLAPLTGRIVKVVVRPGDEVARDAPLAVLEAMKMDHVLKAPRDGVVSRVCVSEGQQVMQDTALFELEEFA
ncbi:MAG: ATP-grasp domain-containing protein [Boseongicola sp. SB0667_bin_21]|nr:ATP-grasp domain-containing protein [Boseongicola sp. SB0667_bin_21]